LLLLHRRPARRKRKWLLLRLEVNQNTWLLFNGAARARFGRAPQVIIMATVTLRLICDRAAAASFSVMAGDGWFRVAITVPAFDSRTGPLVAKAKATLVFLGGAHPPRVVIDGPDAPDDTENVGRFIADTWAAWECPAEAAMTPVGAGAASAARPLFGATEPAARPHFGATEPAPRPNFNATEPAPMRGADGLVEKMVETLRTYVGQFGAAPDFAAGRPKDRMKAYNYIRATAAAPTAPDAVVEEVRRRLASSLPK
jgi:hypothetical protein